ncbi:MAG: hypothetical protein OXT09_24785, partial [Myxococcales bacterium]|nr:hypothetical protein [Myxococcales bacterium]
PAPAPAPAPAPVAQPAPAHAPAPAPAPARRYDGQISGSAPPTYEEGYDGPPEDGGKGFEVPAFSIRMDPLNWLIEGRLGLELEAQVWEIITVELVPIFVANEEPPSFNFSGRDDPVSQHSNGLGAISGASIGAGFWLQGKPFRGYVLRAILTNYGYTYKASDGSGVFDQTTVTERRFVGFFGSYSRFAFFTIGGGIGIGYELNQTQRCFANGPSGLVAANSGCRDEEEHLIRLDRDEDDFSVADINGGLHPIYLEARLSLGIAFD